MFGVRASGRPAACRGGAGRRPASHGRPGRGRLRAEPAQAAGRRATAEVGRAAVGRGRQSGRRAAGGGRTSGGTCSPDSSRGWSRRDPRRRPRVWRRAASSWTGQGLPGSGPSRDAEDEVEAGSTHVTLWITGAILAELNGSIHKLVKHSWIDVDRAGAPWVHPRPCIISISLERRS